MRRPSNDQPVPPAVTGGRTQEERFIFAGLTGDSADGARPWTLAERRAGGARVTADVCHVQPPYYWRICGGECKHDALAAYITASWFPAVNIALRTRLPIGHKKQQQKRPRSRETLTRWATNRREMHLRPRPSCCLSSLRPDLFPSVRQGHLSRLRWRSSGACRSADYHEHLWQLTLRCCLDRQAAAVSSVTHTSIPIWLLRHGSGGAGRGARVKEAGCEGWWPRPLLSVPPSVVGINHLRWAHSYRTTH